MKPLLEIKNLSITTSQGERILHNVSFSLKQGQTLGLVGPSGSGKSLTGLTIMGLQSHHLQITSGEVLFEGSDLLKNSSAQWNQIRGAKIALIFQEPMTSLNPVMPILDQIAEVFVIHQKLSWKEARQAATTLLKEVELDLSERSAKVYPHHLSGGERQRVMIAMALACKPQLLIADEPTTSLDATTQKQILDLLLKLQQKYSMAMIFISHNFKVVKRMSSTIYSLSQGVMNEDSSSEAFEQKQNSEFKTETVHAVEESQKPILAIHQLGVSFQLQSSFWRKKVGEVIALKNVSFQIFKGQSWGIVGESGSGKSTLAKVLVNLINADEGQVLFENQNLNSLSDLSKKIQIVFQDPYSSLNSKHTILRILTEPLQFHFKNWTADDLKKKASELMVQVGLDPDWLVRYPHEFSGGQRQRIAIARAISIQPQVIIFDEAVSALDSHICLQILNLIEKLKRELNLTIIFISHDLHVIRSIADHVVILNKGSVVEIGTTKDIFTQVRQGYTHQLLSASLD